MESILSGYQEEDGMVEPSQHFWMLAYESYDYSLRRGLYRFAAFSLEQMSFRSSKTVTECTEETVSTLFLK